MRRTGRTKLRAAAVVAFAVAAPAATPQGTLPPAALRPVDFAIDVEPIFRRHCTSCHGERDTRNGLRLDRRADALRGGYSGPAIEPGDSANSLLIRMIAGAAESQRMPLDEAPLTPGQIGLLRAWIDQGASWPERIESAGEAEPSVPRSRHWALQPLKRPRVPRVDDEDWATSPIDRFVLARLEAEGLEPSPEADRHTLIRRVSLDLVGMPPSPAEVDAFVGAGGRRAYEELVHRLLESPHFGEKWGRHWLDLARYADSDGYRGDSLRPHAWRYRQWVIEALNRDMPFDRFSIEQIAGDLLPGAGVEQRVATGFHRNTPTNTEGGSDPEEFRFEQVVNRTSTVGTVWLGMTVGCAQCHDHKYDPLTQKEFYELFAFFDELEEVDIDAPLPGERGPRLAALPAYQRARRELLEQHDVSRLKAAWERKLLHHADNPGESPEWDVSFDELRTFVNLGERILRTPPERRTVKHEKAITDFFVDNYHRVLTKPEIEALGWEELSKQLRELDRGLPPFAEAQAVHIRPNPRAARIYLRGNYQDPGVRVRRGTPGWLHPMPARGEATRLDLARWLVSPDNPLTPRVTVNRFWQELFGRGLVATPEDFGVRGEPPTHPELLDWLAVELVERDWSVKSILEQIVTSASYRQSSTARAELTERDPRNLLLARQSRFRLPAELIRDSALAVSGLLYPAVGGRSVRPPQPAGALRIGSEDDSRWQVSRGPDRYRRGLYIQYYRMSPYPLLASFDGSVGYDSKCRRDRSNTPLQALHLLNDPVFLEAAQALAVRVLAEPGADLADRLRHAFRLGLVRSPGVFEINTMARSLRRQQEIFERDQAAARGLFPASLPGVTQAEGAAWVAVSSALMNLDEFLTRE